jgi:hypothetical protein
VLGEARRQGAAIGGKGTGDFLLGVLQGCLRFVEHFAHHSEQAQLAFAPHVRLLLALAGEGLHAVSAVTAICRNNLKLCISLDEALIERLVAVVAGAGGKPARRYPHYLAFLEKLCIVQAPHRLFPRACAPAPRPVPNPARAATLLLGRAADARRRARGGRARRCCGTSTMCSSSSCRRGR